MHVNPFVLGDIRANFGTACVSPSNVPSCGYYAAWTADGRTRVESAPLPVDVERTNPALALGWRAAVEAVALHLTIHREIPASYGVTRLSRPAHEIPAYQVGALGR